MINDIDDDFRAKMEILQQVMRRHRVQTGMTGERISTRLGRGKSWIAELETGHRTVNYTINRLVNWAKAIEAQEFGLYVVTFEGYADIRLHPKEEEGL